MLRLFLPLLLLLSIYSLSILLVPMSKFWWVNYTLETVHHHNQNKSLKCGIGIEIDPLCARKVQSIINSSEFDLEVYRLPDGKLLVVSTGNKIEDSKRTIPEELKFLGFTYNEASEIENYKVRVINLIKLVAALNILLFAALSLSIFKKFYA